MNIWNFAMTPIIGSFSPSFSLNFGKQEEAATDKNNIITKKEEM